MNIHSQSLPPISPNKGYKVSSKLKHILTATSVTMILAGEVAMCLGLLLWALAGLFFLPLWLVLTTGTGILVLTLYLSLIVFVHTIRVEKALEQNQETSDIPWNPFKKVPVLPAD